MTVDAKYWTEAKATGGGRNGIAGLVNGQLTVTMTSPKELGGSGLGHNPEELFATGYAACYLGAMRFAAASEKAGRRARQRHGERPCRHRPAVGRRLWPEGEAGGQPAGP
jgi:organic hydroperoxide reductase OsmC/OhrA